MLISQSKKQLITNSLLELGDDITDGQKGKGRKFVSRFIEAGVAHYQDFGDVLITKETLDRFIHTMVGCPVIIQHKEITDKNADKERVGVVSNVFYSNSDGWYYCEGIIWNKQAIDLVKNQGWNVSCTYDFVSDNQEKTHNGKKIDMEFIDGEFLHLALVNNPRYERANIVINSKDQVENEDKKFITVGKGEEKHVIPIDYIKKDKKEKDREEKREETKEQNAPSEEKEIERLIDIADSVSMFNSGSIEKRLNEKAIKELDEIEISKEKKEETKQKLKELHKDILKKLANAPSQYKVGLAEFNKRVGQKKTSDNLDKAYGLQSQRDNIIKELKENIKKEKTKQQNISLGEKAKEALSKGLMEFEHNGETWFRTSKRSKSYIGLDRYTQSKYDKMKSENSKDTVNNWLKEDEISSWVTTESGARIPIKKGLTIKEGLKHFAKISHEHRKSKNKEKDEAYKVLASAIGKSPDYVKRHYNSKNVQELISKAKTDDSLTTKTSFDPMENFNIEELERADTNTQEKWIEQAQDIIEGRSKTKGEYESYFDEYSEYLADLDKKQKEIVKKSKGDLEKAEKELVKLYGVESLEDLSEETLTDFYKELNKYYEETENKAQNGKDNIFMAVMDELKDFILGVVGNECDKDKDKDKVENEDKRKIIDEIGGILKGKVDEEVWRTVIGKLEKVAYNPSETDKADNKAKNEDEKDEEKEIADVENKCGKAKNSMDKAREIVFGGSQPEFKPSYVSREERLKLGDNY